MRYWFVATRKDTGKVQFKAPMRTKRCRGRASGGHRCRRKISLSYPYCWQHTKSEEHLEVKESKVLASIGIRGQKGLYAYAPGSTGPVFRKGEGIVRYRGERINDRDLERRYQYKDSPHGAVMSPYAMELDRDWSIDAALLRGVAAYANSPRGTGVRPNAQLDVDETPRKPQAWLIATKNIYHGQEILTNYGREYFKLSALDTKVVQR